MKDTLRKQYKALRKEMTAKDKSILDLSIFKTFTNHFSIENKNVSIFLPIEKLIEVNTWHFIDNINACYFLPVVKSKILKHIKYVNKAQLELSDWDILEPTYGEEITPDKFDIVIVPLLAFDQKGNRLGYGAGFYDGFLKDCNPHCIFIGVSHFKATKNVIDIYPTDIPLHYCVTPNQVYKF